MEDLVFFFGKLNRYCCFEKFFYFLSVLLVLIEMILGCLSIFELGNSEF